LWALPVRDKWLLAQSLVVLPANGLALRLMSFKRWQTILSRLAAFDGQRSDATVDSTLPVACRTAELVRIAAGRGPYAGSCLPRSLTIWWLLRRQKVDSKIRFGARKECNQLKAHAWVELHGIALNNVAVVDGFTPFEGLMTADEVTTR
jgi:hypothetical protein